MGLSIGQIPAALAGLRSSPEFGRVRLREEAAPSAPRTNESDPQPAQGAGGRDGNGVPRVGFGEGTLSPAGAALNTISRTVEETRRRQPTLDDIRTRFQDAAVERRQAAQAASLAETPDRERTTPTPRANNNDQQGFSRIERGIPEPSARVRQFVGTVKDTTIQTVDRNETQAPAAQNVQPNNLPREERAAPAENTNRPRIDVRV